MTEENLIGKKFNMLTVIRQAPKPDGLKSNGRYWVCVCDCGNEKTMLTATLKSMKIKSCGCYKKKCKSGLKHGLKNTRFYKIWQGMKSRCDYEKNGSYSYYGGKGIKYCSEWSSFESFRDDMYEDYLNHVSIFGEKQTTLDRIESDKDYSKENCKWSTINEQNGNRCTVKSFKAVSPDGDIYFANNYSKFATEHNLNKTSIWCCLEGRNKTHNGWKFERVDET